MIRRKQELDIANLDLNLLKVFTALLEVDSATAAGERLNMAQSSVSHSLARLRKVFNDPLFVRSRRGLQPSPFALELREPISKALEMIEGALKQRQVFDPETSDRTFGLLMTDAGEMFFVPPLIARIRAVAPHIRLVVQQLPRQDYKEALESGVADIAVGQLPRGQTDLIQQFLSAEPFYGFARPGHPILKNPTLAAFLAADHLAVGKPAVSEMQVEKALGAFASRRRVMLELRHYLPATIILMQSDLIAVLPRPFSTIAAAFGDLQSFRPPFSIRPMRLHQFWHARTNSDDGCKWLRSQIASLFTVRRRTE